MIKKLYLPIVLLIVFSMTLAACAPAVATEPAAVPPVAAPVTEVPPTVVPPAAETAPDIATLYAQMIGALHQGYAGIKPADVSTAMASATPPFLLDVRDAAELQKDGYIKGAVNIPVRNVLKNLDKLPAPDAKIIVYCGSAQRGGMLTGVLRVLGYTNVLNMSGGLGGWKAAKLPVETGSMPEAAKTISTPIIADQALYTMLDKSMSTLPDGFLATKVDKVKELLASATPPTLIDLRTADEVKSGGYIKGSINIPVLQLFTSLDKLPAKDAAIILYCGSAQRGSIAVEGLRLLGYTNVRSISGGFAAWKAAGLPVATGEIAKPAASEAKEPTFDPALFDSVDKFVTSMPDTFYAAAPAATLKRLGVEPKPVLIDVRGEAELKANGYIEGQQNIPLKTLLDKPELLPTDKDQPIIVYCSIGHRGAMAMTTLRLLGYTDVTSIGGGFNNWVKAGLPIVKPS